MADKIRWCLRQRKGIELVKPNENLASAYLLKAENALASMRANKGNLEWEISSSYYVMYFSLYAILMKVGVKCEIHSCTLEFMRVYLGDYFTVEEMEFLEDSCSTRVEAQYYVAHAVDDLTYQRMIEDAPDFMIKCKNVVSRIGEADVHRIREDLQKIGR